MDILNWIYLVKNKFTRTTVENPATDLLVLGADVSYQKRGDKYQNYVMPVEDFATSIAPTVAPALYDTANVTQGTSITTAVTVNAASGIITTVSATTSANSTEASGFVVNNTNVLSTSKIQLTCQYAGQANGVPVALVSAIANGSFTVRLGNGGSAALNAVVKIHFTVID
jgi:hypothetical protein